MTGDRSLLRLVALFDAAKGTAALGAALWLAHGLDERARAWVAHLVMHLPSTLGPQVLLHLLDDARWLPLLLAAYAALRLAEGWGLWRDAAWAGWLGVASGALYLPVELSHLWHHPTLAAASVTLANAAVVAWLAWRMRAKARSLQSPPT